MGLKLNLPRKMVLPCDRKLRHDSMRAAERSLREVWQEHRIMGAHSRYRIEDLRRLVAYQCRHCKDYHLGRKDSNVHGDQGPC